MCNCWIKLYSCIAGLISFRCSTCHLDYKYCPGHTGHIALPVPVYHPLFFAQMLRLLRSTCVYCFHLRMAKAVVNRYVCKLKLIQHGLLLEAQQLDDIQIKTKTTGAAGKVKGAGADEEGPGDDIETDDEDDLESFLAKRERFVNKAIRRSKANSSNWNSSKVMSVAEERRKLVKEFLADIMKPRKCNRCQA